MQSKSFVFLLEIPWVYIVQKKRAENQPGDPVCTSIYGVI